MDKGLKRLSRADLVEIIYQLQQERDRLQADNETLRESLMTENSRLRARLERMETEAVKNDTLAQAVTSLTTLLEQTQSYSDYYMNRIAGLQEQERIRLTEIDQVLSNVKMDNSSKSDEQ